MEIYINIALLIQFLCKHKPTKQLFPRESINEPSNTNLYNIIQRIVFCNQGTTLKLGRHTKADIG